MRDDLPLRFRELPTAWRVEHEAKTYPGRYLVGERTGGWSATCLDRGKQEPRTLGIFATVDESKAA